MARSAVAIRHVAFEDLGLFADVLAAEGYEVRYLDAGYEATLEPHASEADLLIVLGGPIGAYEEADYPFLREELAILERRLAADRPTLGICLGSQLMARALGARVYPGVHKEIGWAPLTLTEEGRISCLGHLDPAITPVLHWHGDTFDLPKRATRLASTDSYPNQAFSVGHNILAVQFHPEVTVRGMERWFIGHTGEIAATGGISVAQLREQTGRFGPILEVQGRRMLESWLAGLEVK